METFSRGTLAPWYVTGVIEADGVFTFSRSGAQIALYFALKRPADDEPLLDRLRAALGGGGRLYAAPPRSLYWRVTRIAELDPIVAHLDACPLQGRKAAAYELWREMVTLKRAFRRPERAQLEALARRLSALR